MTPADAARNEFDDLVRRAKGYHVHPLTPGEKAGVLYAEAELNQYKRLLDEQVDATNTVTKELNACYAELGIFRHTDAPERGPDAIRRLRAALKNIVNPIAYLQKEADEKGAQLNGAIAVSLSDNPDFLKELARDALRRRADSSAIRGKREGG